MTVAPAQRFSRSRPCPICGGYDAAPRGQGERCHGFSSDDAKYIHCASAKHAGALAPHPSTGLYVHCLVGDCRCGVRHDPRPKRQRQPTAPTQVHEYRDAAGQAVFRTARVGSGKQKRIWQQRPDGQGGWIDNLNGVEKVLYRLPELLAAPKGSTVYVCEGEKAAEAVERLGLLATTAPLGARKWQDSYSPALAGQHIIILPDNDDDGRAHAEQVARSVAPVATSVKVLTLPGLPPKGDAVEWVNAGGTRETLRQLVDATPEWRDPDAPEPPAPQTLEQVLATFGRWLYMPDTGEVEITLAAYRANLSGRSPIWLLVVGSPGFGKTELINTLTNLPQVHPLSVFTPASLLSGTPKRDRLEGAQGGVLRQIGERGILTLKDFTSVLSMHGDARVEALGALREIYDGSWIRFVGSDGGQQLAWSGYLGLIGGCTPAIDQYHAVMSALGERFIFYRLPEMDEEQQLAMASRAFDLPGTEDQMRRELAEAVRGLFARIGETSTPVSYGQEEKQYLLRLAQFTVKCRGAVIRDSTPKREIEHVPGHEAPTRLTIVLRRLFEGLLAIGVERYRAWELLRRVAMDSMPQMRRDVLEHLSVTTTRTTAGAVGRKLHRPTTTVARALEDLEAYDMVDRVKDDEDNENHWQLTPWARTAWERLGSLPEISVDLYILHGEREKGDNPHNHKKEIPGRHGFTMPTNGDVGSGLGQAPGSKQTNGRVSPPLRVPTGRVGVDRVLYERLIAEGVEPAEAVTRAQIGRVEVLTGSDGDDDDAEVI